MELAPDGVTVRRPQGRAHTSVGCCVRRFKAKPVRRRQRSVLVKMMNSQLPPEGGETPVTAGPSDSSFLLE